MARLKGRKDELDRENTRELIREYWESLGEKRGEEPRWGEASEGAAH